MILTVDIGNSNIVVGLWENEALIHIGRILTKKDYTVKELIFSLKEQIQEYACESVNAYEGAILSSVVPEITDKVLFALENITGTRPLLMGPFLYTGVDVSDYEQGAIGMDRIVDMSAALALYGTPVMVCDLGTCTTITVAGVVEANVDDNAEMIDVNGKKTTNGLCGKILGGMICPGVQLSLDAEARRASQLPQLTADNVGYLLGKDTASNMLAGAVAGCGMMISELADRLKSGDVTNNAVRAEDGELSVNRFNDLKVVITGGLGEVVLPWIKCDAKVHYEQNLLLRGLYEIFICNRSIPVIQK